MKKQRTRGCKKVTKRWKSPALAKDVCVRVSRKGHRRRAAGCVTRLDVRDDVLIGVYYRLDNMNECYALVENVIVDRTAEKRRQARNAEREKGLRAR